MSGDNNDRNKKWIPSPPTLPAGPATGRPLPPHVDETTPLRGRIDTRRGFDPLSRLTTPPIEDEGDFEGDEPLTTAEPIIDSHPRLNASGAAAELPPDDAYDDDAQATVFDPHVMDPDPVRPTSARLEPIGGLDSGRGTVDLGDERDAYMASAYVREPAHLSSSVIEPPLPPSMRSPAGSPTTPPPLAALTEKFERDHGQDEFLPVTVRGKRQTNDVARGSEEPMARGSSERSANERALADPLDRHVPHHAAVRPPGHTPTAPPPLPRVITARSGITKPPPLPRSTGISKPPPFSPRHVTVPGAPPSPQSGPHAMPPPGASAPHPMPSMETTLPPIANSGPQPTSMTMPGRPYSINNTTPEAPLFLPSDAMQNAPAQGYPAGPAALAAQAPMAEMRVISMKTPMSGESEKLQRHLPKVELRNVADVARMPPQGPVGRLAAPRDTRDVRSRRMQDLVIWSSVVVITASLVTLLIWFVARG